MYVCVCMYVCPNVLLPAAWKVSRVSSYTAPKVHAGHSTQDHVATCVDVDVTLGKLSGGAEMRCRKTSAADVINPEYRDRIRAVLHNAPQVPWTVSVHAHAAVLTKHVQDGPQATLLKKSARPKHKYLQAHTWELQQAVARIRHALHHRRSMLDAARLRVVLQVWRSRRDTFEEVFLDNR